MSDRPLSATDVERMLGLLREELAAAGTGTLDEARLREVIEFILGSHPEQALVRELVQLGAVPIVVPPGEDGERVEIRLGFPPGMAPGSRSAGRAVHLCFVLLRELVRGGEG